jgi:hypothetical protein
MSRLAREPLIQFLFIGACIYAGYGLFGAPEEKSTDYTIVVDTARIEGFIGQWRARWNRPPTEQELEGVIDAYVRENILYRAALEMGLDQDDPITRRRMAQKLEFLTNDIALFKEPTADELRTYFNDNQAQYRDPDLITFTHVFFDPDKRDDSTLEDAANVLAQLEAAGEPGTASAQAGDRFMLQNHFEAATELDVRRQLGSGFTETIMTLEPGRWHGPVLSGYGVHLVYVNELIEAPAPVFEDVRSAVLQDWQKQQQEEFNAEFFASLKNRYEIVISQPPPGSVLEVPPDPSAADAGKRPERSAWAPDAVGSSPAS